MLKKLLLPLGVVACTLGAADIDSLEAERRMLIEEFAAREKVDNSEKDKAFTNVELIGAAGRQSITSESKVLRAVEYKLRTLKTSRQRQILLKRFSKLIDQCSQIENASYEGTGRLENFFRYGRVAELQNRFAEILLLSAAEENVWYKICNTSGKIGKYDISFTDGYDTFSAKMYDNTHNLEIMLYPRHCFEFNNRYFAFVISDLPGAVNYDFRENFICEFKDGKIIKSIQLETLINLNKLEFVKDKVVVSGTGCREENKPYRKELAL